MRILKTEIPSVLIIQPKRFDDDRGFFSETYNKAVFREHGIELEFVQDNHSLSRPAGVVRGLHFQEPPFAQAKLIRVVRGAVFDVAIDLRRNSPTFGHHVSRVISAANWDQILIPIGFAHGFCTLEPDTEVTYKITDVYAPDHERGILWTDPDIGIDWPIEAVGAILSDKDRTLPKLRDIAETLPF